MEKNRLDNYIENILDGTFELMSSGPAYLYVKTGSFEHTFRITKDTTVETLKADIRKELTSRIKFHQNILDKIV